MKYFILLFLSFLIIFGFLITRTKNNSNNNFNNNIKNIKNTINNQQPNYKLITLYPTDFSSFNKSIITNYDKYFATGKTWEDSLTRSVTDSYFSLFNTTILSANVQQFLSDKISTFKGLINNDYYNIHYWLVYTTTNFNPDPPSSYQYYEISLIDSSYYINIKLNKTECTLEDLFTSMTANSITSCYLPDSVVLQLQQNSNYKKAISTIKININDIRLVVSYNYIDPMDIFINPSRYTFSGIGITDSKQPSFVLLVDPSQYPYLNRLLKNSDVFSKTPIHSWYPSHNYTIIWKDEWSSVLQNYYNKIVVNDKKNAFIESLNYLLVVEYPTNKKIPMNYNLSSLFMLLPSTFYWMITLLSLLPSVKDPSDLFYYPKFPGKNQQECKEQNYIKCQNSCITNFQNYYDECSEWQCDGTDVRCDINCLLLSMQYINYYCRENLNDPYDSFNGIHYPSINSCVDASCH